MPTPDYPPGVTGRERQLDTTLWEDVLYCPQCCGDTLFYFESYGHQTDAWCCDCHFHTNDPDDFGEPNYEQDCWA